MPRLAPVTKTDFPAMITSSPRSWVLTVSAIQMPQCRKIGLRMCAQFLDQPASVLEGETREGKVVTRGENRTDCEGASRGRRGVSRADRAAPARASGALLSDAGIPARCRGRLARHPAGRVAGPRRISGTGLGAHLALPDSHQPVPQRSSLGPPTPGQGVEHAD